MRTRIAKQEEQFRPAAEWWARFQEVDPTPEEVAEWLSWMEQDERNAELFTQVQELASRMRLTRETTPERLSLLTSGSRSAPSRSSRGGNSRFRRFALAAVVLAGVGIAGFLSFNRWLDEGGNAAVHESITTPIAGLREVKLPDGSRVILGGASSVDTVFSAERRVVRLKAGEAFFEVEQDRTRPFVVETGFATVRALGTAFNVRFNAERVAVTVAEGRVHVAHTGDALASLAVAAGLRHPQVAELGTSEQLIIEPDSKQLLVTSADPRRATAWRKGRLEFADEPLDVVIDNVGRYSQVAIHAEDRRLHDITYTGTFVPGHLDSWLGALKDVFDLEIDREGEAVTVRLSARDP